MITHRAWKLAVSIILFTLAAHSPAGAQSMPPGYGGYGAPPGAMPYGGMPGSPYGPMGGGVSPAAFDGGGGMGGYADESGMYDDGYAEGGEDCPRRPIRHLLDFILPNDEGGMCAPRFFNLHVDAARLKREKISRRGDFTAPFANPPGGTLLSTDSFNLNDAYGWGATAAFMVGAGSNIEIGYLGGFNFRGHAEVGVTPNPTPFSSGPFYSVFSNYGLSPLGGFAQTDGAYFHNIDYSSAFNSYELLFRRRWQGADCRFQGSWLAGLRYFQMNEEFTHKTRSQRLAGINTVDYFMDYFVGTSNALTGLQVGCDAWVTLIPGLRMGGEFKAGVYGNHVHQDTSITFNQITIAPQTANQSVAERVGHDSVAFIAEADMMATYRINYNWTIRFGYQLLFVDGVALATENFNNAPPAQFANAARVRTPFINDNGNLFLHGATIGAEWIW